MKNMKKQWILAGLAALLLSAGTVQAEETKALQPAGEAAYTLSVPGKEAKEITADLMVPLRETAETLGFKVTWNQGKTLVENKTVHTTVTLGEDKYTLTEGKDKTHTFSLGAAPYLKGNTTYVPLSLFGHLLGHGETLTIAGQEILLTSKEETKAEEAPEAAAAETAPSVQVSNPWEDFGTLEEAEQAAGVTMTLPEREDTPSYRAVKGSILEVIYKDSEGKETLCIRKGNDTSDVSGDYNSYPTIKTITVDGINTRMKGNGNAMRLAVWVRDGHAYSISAAAPVTIAEMMALVRAVQ